MSQDKIPEPPKIPLDYEVKCEVALTPEQQRIVKEQTGRDMDVLILEDKSGLYTKRMPDSDPEEFTVLAIKQAKLLNRYDEEYTEYLNELADYQDSLGKPDPMDELAEAMSIAAIQEAERLRLFYMKEAEECQNAREIAKIVWGKKDKPQV